MTRLARKWYKSQLQSVIYLQSCIRRRAARKELLVLKAEAKSADHFKEVSYKLENKVVELTQSITTLKTENKELTQKVSNMDLQIQQWVQKHEKLDKEAKAMEAQLRDKSVPQLMFDALKTEKESVESQHSTALGKMAQLTARMKQIQNELKLEKEKNEALEARQMNMANNKELTDLKAQIVSLKSQLAKAIHTRQMSPMKQTSNGNRNNSPSNNNSRRLFADEKRSESQDSIKPLRTIDNVLTNRKTRRNSSGDTAVNIIKNSFDHIIKAEELGNRNPRPISVGQSNTIAGGKSSLFDVISDNPEEEVKPLLLVDVVVLTFYYYFRLTLFFDKRNYYKKKC